MSNIPATIRSAVRESVLTLKYNVDETETNTNYYLLALRKIRDDFKLICR